MIRQYNIKTNSSIKRGRIRPDFELLPVNDSLPIVKSQPVRNFVQYTYTNPGNAFLSYKDIVVIEPSTVKILTGATISFSVIVEDPSNVLDPFDTTNLKFVWKRDDSEISELTQINDGKGTAQVYIENATSDINGVYYCEITNELGTTRSDSFTIEIVDPKYNNLLYNNIVANTTGESGLDNWEVSDDIVVRQFDDDIQYTKNFASIYSDATLPYNWEKQPDGFFIQKILTKVNGEIPFTFSTSNNWINFNDAWSRLKKGEDLANDKEASWTLTELTPNIVKNEKAFDMFAQMFPSPYTIDSYNRNDRTLPYIKQSLVDTFGTVPTYFTRDRLKFIIDGGSITSTMTQTIDLTEIGDWIDGKVTGIDSINAHYFNYIAAGLSGYKFALYDKADGTGKIVDILDNYILDAKEWINFIQNKSFTKYSIPNNVARIDIIPVAHDKITVSIDCIGASGQVIKKEEIEGPSAKDVFAIKEKFYLSAYFNKLFNSVTEFKGNYPVFIYNRKYFEITPTSTATSRNKNLKYLKDSTYPKYNSQSGSWDSGDFIVKGFDRGAAAFFGYNSNFTIPPNTRFLRIGMVFENSSPVLLNADSKVIINDFNWDFEEIYADHLKNGSIYPYNYPKTGLSQIKLVLGANSVDINSKYTTYYLPNRSVWKVSKQQLNQNIHDETKEVVYNYTDGRNKANANNNTTNTGTPPPSKQASGTATSINKKQINPAEETNKAKAATQTTGSGTSGM